MTSRYEAADLAAVTPIPFASRRNRVTRARFGHVLEPPPAVESLIESLPDLLAATAFRTIVARWAEAVGGDRAVVLLLGGHVVKAGCSPFLIDCVARGWVTHLALNGATAIHDFEIALFGETSEDVAANLADGSFGLSDETGRGMAEAAEMARGDGLGLGEALGRWLLEHDPPVSHAAESLLAQAYVHAIPLTVHTAIGAEIHHQHPAFDGAAAGAASHLDFRILAAGLRGLHDGGVVVNFGSAVVLPEVFVKALNVARHLWPPLRNFTAADFDMLRQYRPLANVIGRPVLEGGEGYHVTGHHELLIPLLYYALRARLAREPS
ncbi:MAG TPA: hypothetical protein VM737_02905 [Gemmatimonadota bacterium]|nr:hypothetical protein [Gemmatimonadota bacterium]